MMEGSDRAPAALRAIEPALILVCGFAVTLLLARSFPIQSDEGYTLNGAWQLWTGMRMYDDFRLFVGPGSSYAVYAVWRIAGSPSFLAARLASLALSFWGRPASICCCAVWGRGASAGRWPWASGWRSATGTCC